jgi:hypothetical protein
LHNGSGLKPRIAAQSCGSKYEAKMKIIARNLPLTASRKWFRNHLGIGETSFAKAEREKRVRPIPIPGFRGKRYATIETLQAFGVEIADHDQSENEIAAVAHDRELKRA